MNPIVPSRSAVVVLLALSAALLVAVPRPAAALSSFSNVEQFDVDTFVDAGLAVSRSRFTPEDTTAVVLATDANFPDGLTAAAVAGSVDGPVLFTAPAALDPGTGAEIDRLLEDGDTVYVMGGTTAVSDDVTAALSAYTVQRIAGASRVETAVEAAAVVGVPNGGRVLLARAFGPDGANVASDRTTGWVDAVSCGAFAAAEGLPIYLTQTEVLTASTRDALAASPATDVTICGGEAAVSSDVEAALIALGLEVDRVQGVTRVETAVAAATDLFGRATAAGGEYVIAPGYGESFGFGLAAAPLGKPILLTGQSEPTSCTNSAQPSRETLCHLGTATAEDPAQLLVIGGTSVIADEVSNAAGEAAGGVDIGDLDVLDAPDGVTATDDIDDDGTALTVTWDEVADPDDILVGYNVYVDGARSGPSPTVGASTTELQLDGLTPDREVTVTVTAVDTGGRESEMSAAKKATPVDEDPEPITNFTLAPADREVRLSWDRGPADAASYTISRATAAMGSCTGVTYAQVTEITNPQTLTFTDTGLTNGTAYCYRHVVTDAADNEGAPNDQGPVTPAVPALGVTLNNVPDEFQFHTGFPHPITTTTTLDQGGTFVGLQRVVEFIPENAALDPIIIAEGQHPAMGEVTTVLQLREDRFVDDNGRLTTAAAGADGATNTPTTAYDDATGILRVSVFRPGSSASAQDSAADVTITRAPERITGLQALGGNNIVIVTWTPSPEPTTTQYEIQRAAVTVTEMTDDPAVCGTPAASYAPVETRSSTIAGATTYNDRMVSNDGALGGDLRYCYRVRALRPASPGLTPADQMGAFSAVDSANPDIVAAALTIEAPSSGAVVSERGETTVRWTIAVPQGGTPTTDTTLLYCVNFSQTVAEAQPTCKDGGTGPGGFTAMRLINDPDNVVTTAVGPGQMMTFTARWNVPNINQTGTQRGAVRLSTQGSTDTNDGIQFL